MACRDQLEVTNASLRGMFNDICRDMGNFLSSRCVCVYARSDDWACVVSTDLVAVAKNK
jgi:hypothetical protein